MKPTHITHSTEHFGILLIGILCFDSSVSVAMCSTSGCLEVEMRSEYNVNIRGYRKHKVKDSNFILVVF